MNVTSWQIKVATGCGAGAVDGWLYKETTVPIPFPSNSQRWFLLAMTKIFP